MILRKYKTIIKDEIDRVLNDNKYPKIEYQIKEIANPEFGQLYTNIPFILSRIIKKDAIDIANNIAKNIIFSNEINVSTSKPGYLNFKIDHNNLFYEVLSKSDKNIKESLNIGKGEKTVEQRWEEHIDEDHFFSKTGSKLTTEIGQQILKFPVVHLQNTSNDDHKYLEPKIRDLILNSGFLSKQHIKGGKRWDKS